MSCRMLFKGQIIEYPSNLLSKKKIIMNTPQDVLHSQKVQSCMNTNIYVQEKTTEEHKLSKEILITKLKNS